MKMEDLFETPQHTFPTEFGLDDSAINNKLAKEWLSDKRKQPIEQFGDGQYTLYELPRAFVLVDHSDPQHPAIVYAMQYKLVFHKFIGRQCVQQIAVWRDTKHAVTEGIARRIFFDHLLQNYKTVITDSMQTSDGQRFWDKRILEGIKQGYRVYYVNLLPEREISEITDERQYRVLVKNKEIWGDVQKHQARRIVITTSPL